MKFKVDNEELLELSETQKKVIMNDVTSEEFEADMKRRVVHIVSDKYNNCFKRLKEEWEPKLKQAGVKSIPLDNDEFAKLVFSQPDYMNRSQRETKTKMELKR
jgi:hypothetical protein